MTVAREARIKVVFDVERPTGAERRAAPPVTEERSGTTRGAPAGGRPETRLSGTRGEVTQPRRDRERKQEDAYVDNVKELAKDSVREIKGFFAANIREGHDFASRAMQAVPVIGGPLDFIRRNLVRYGPIGGELGKRLFDKVLPGPVNKALKLLGIDVQALSAAATLKAQQATAALVGASTALDEARNLGVAVGLAGVPLSVADATNLGTGIAGVVNAEVMLQMKIVEAQNRLFGRGVPMAGAGLLKAPLDAFGRGLVDMLGLLRPSLTEGGKAGGR